MLRYGVSITRLKGFLISNSPRVPASTASASGLYLLLCSQMETPIPRNLDVYIGFRPQQFRFGFGFRCRCRCRLVSIIPMILSTHVESRTKEYSEFNRRRLLLILNLTRCTPSNVNLTVCVHYARSKSITLCLMPPDEWRKRVAQLGLRFHLHVRQSNVPALEVVMGRGVAGKRHNDWPKRRGVGGSRRMSEREETK